MKRKIVLFLVIALMGIALLMAPAPPTAQCQTGDRCAETRKQCYNDYMAVWTFCYTLTGDLKKCDKEFNESYRTCAGDCW